MLKLRISLSLALFVLTACTGMAQQRDLLYSKNVSANLQAITTTLRDLKSAPKCQNELTRNTQYLVRLTPRRYVFDGEKLRDSAILGGNPFVFLTTPDSVAGLSLLDMYVNIGYEAEDILRWQRDEEMVMIVFKYPAEIAPTSIVNGLLPDAWNKSVYNPTWANMFALLHRLASLEPATQDCVSPFKMAEAERQFILSFPEEGKQKVQRVAYPALKAASGPEWKYRSLLEQKLSVFEHFRGTGHTQNEVRDPDGVETGLIEAVGPNLNLKDLPELVIIRLGKLEMKDSYGTGCAFCRPPN